MKIKEIAAKYGVNGPLFEQFIRKKGYEFSETFIGDMIIEDSKVSDYVIRYQQALQGYRQIVKEEEEFNEIKKKAMAEMLISSGFNFEGYTITKYSGYISGDDAISVDRGLAIFGSGIDVKDKLMESLVTIRRNALRELKSAAYDLGCNAIIGVDFDYLTLDPQTANLGGGTTYLPYVFGVTANGNAVVIEKNKKEE